ncbi:MAG: S-layer homology domain-containing protein, partial [Clostridia bacterium]|nr:S-layer homology domain-containing protein [Clostridia bacterium]
MKKFLAVVLTLCLLTSVSPLFAFAASPFTDLSGHWAESYVLPLYEKGIISGKSVNTFDPEANMTRAEFLTLALKVPSVPTPNFEKSFSDIEESQWFAKTVSEAQSRGLIPAEMVVNNCFNPDAPITREEMTAIIVRLWESFRGILVPVELSFTDTTAFSAWANEAIAKAVSLGVITGNPDGSFNPQGLATRAEASVIFNRLDKKLDEPVVTIKNGEYHPMYGDIYHDDVDIQKMVDDAYASGAGEVTIPAGVYKIPQKRTAHLTLDNMENFTINAYGVTLIFDKHYGRGLQMMNAKNLTINGLTVDYEEPLFTQAKIIGIDPEGSYFDLEIEDGYYKNLSDTQFFTDNMQLHFHDSDFKLSRVDSSGYFFASRIIKKIEENHYRLNSLKLVGVGKHCKVGDYITILSSNEGYPMYIQHSDGINMNDVTIYSGCVGISEGNGN